MPDKFSLLGRGIYTVAEAGRLTGLTENRVRRWIRGYEHGPRGRRRLSPPLIGVVDRETKYVSLSFMDLLEVLHLEHFRASGVSIVRLRAYSEQARESLNVSHPFASYRFRTDGRRVLLSIGRDQALLDLITDQLESPKLLKRMLRGDIDVEGGLAQRWWPLHRRNDVVVDPARRFGAPISDSTGIATEVLAAAYRAEGTIKRAAWWYEVPERAVRHAVRFEQQFRLAA